ncbi:MAG: ribosome maturation factor RimM [Gammaproteobacteria bacterium]
MKPHQMMRKNNLADLSLYIEIAKIGKPKGLKGHFFVSAFTDDIQDFIIKKDFLLLDQSNTLKEFKLVECVLQNNRIIAKAETINNRDEAESVKNLPLLYPKSKLPKLDKLDVYWYELVGMEVINLDGKKLGKVKNVKNFGANDTLDIESVSGKELLIPFVKSRVILEIIREKNTLLVDWEEDF